MARIKTVFSKEQVAHIWAQGPDAIANHGADIRTATGNLFTRDVWVNATAKRAGYQESAIWSYGPHYCLARFAADRTGGHVVLFNDNAYSVTTQRHRSLVRNALSRVYAGGILYCENPAAANRAAHVANLADYRARYEAAIISAGRSRIRENTRAAELARAESIFADANRYASAFGLSRYKLRPMNTAAIAARVKREEKAAAKQRAEQAERAASMAAELLAKYTERLDEWRAGNFDTYRLGWQPKFPIALRVIRSKSNAQTSELPAVLIETSRGAQFPASDARGLWALVKRAKLSGQAYAPLGLRSVPIGSFFLDSIDAGGNVTAGCHTVPFAECAALANALGLES